MLKDLIVAATELVKPIVNSKTLVEYSLSPSLAKILNDKLDFNGLIIDAHTSSLMTSANNFAVIPNQYFSFACYFHDFANELIKYFQLLGCIQETCSQQGLNEAQILFGSSSEIKNRIVSNAKLKNCFQDKADIDLFSKFLDQNDDTSRLGSKNLINSNKGVFSVRAHGDNFGSVILTQINLPNASSSTFGDLVYGLTCIPDVFKQLKNHHDQYAAHLPQKNLAATLPTDSHKSIPKPFLLLAGLSGTGKTRFVREQAAVHRGGDLTNHCLVPVRPDWHEPSDLLGYISRIGQEGARYVVTDLLRFVVHAWQDAKASATSTELACKSPTEMTPHWLCLDEMNLAPVEQYFADYLAVLETRKWLDGNYWCGPLLKAAVIQQLDAAGKAELRKQLGLGAEHNDLWQYFTTIGIPLPPNLIVAGTVNMDETTHGFSRKVIDRAFTIDFGAFYPNDFGDFFEPATRPVSLSFSVLSSVTRNDFVSVPADADGSKSVAFLGAVNVVLKATPFELAYRALNELLLAVVCFQPKDDTELQAVWDDFLMSKVLPRIDGDAEKLGVNDEISLLTQLLSTIDEQFELIISKQRPDLLREKIGGGICMVDCRSKQKLTWMQERLRMNGFTTFWP